MSLSVTLGRDTNQALGIGQFAIDAIFGSLGPGPSDAVLSRTELFHVDALMCGASALALGTNAPTLLREEALTYSFAAGASVFGSPQRVKPEKAVVANCAAVREWDANGTNFGYRPELGHTAGEFGHNDFYPVAIAACQQRELSGEVALRAMVALDEIRGRLAEVFSLKSYKIDHVVHGAIASAAVYGALMDATAEQIESAIGMFVAHCIPWRAIRAGKQLSDSKGASAAISAEAAVLSVHRAMAGFRGPRDVFRNPEAIFRFFEPTTDGPQRWAEHGDCPFDLVLSHSGDDFAIMGMHLKLGLYEHQSAGALQAIIDLLTQNPQLLDSADGSRIVRIRILAYEPAFGIIGNPMKKNPTTRQSADHSMAYIVATLIRKALEHVASGKAMPAPGGSNDDAWKRLMLMPEDYAEDETAIFHPLTRSLMRKIDFEHGGPDYDAKYPEGIPTSVLIDADSGQALDSGLVMFPAGHVRNALADVEGILRDKMRRMAAVSVAASTDVEELVERMRGLRRFSADEVQTVYDWAQV